MRISQATLRRNSSKLLLFLLGVIFLIPLDHANAVTDVRVTTFNVKWYGLESDVNPNERDQYLSHFIFNTLSDSDVIVFQEIVNPYRLHRNVLRGNMYCRTYDERGRSHQYVVICHKKHLRFIVDEASDNNFEIEDVASSSQQSRPALHGVITTSRGRKLFRLIGVHLKAFPQETEKRLRQSEVIARHISNVKRVDDLPIVITGDFNSHSSPNNERNLDDKYLIDRLFKSFRIGMELVDHREITYNNQEYFHQLDLFWHSRNANRISRISVDGPCNDRFTQSSSNKRRGVEDDINLYNRYISDHCPSSITVRQ